MKSKQQRAAERLLGTELPASASGVQFLYYRPGSEQSIFSAYLKFACSAGDYRDFAGRLGLKTSREQATPHLPAAWALPRQLSIDWWDPGSDTPGNATAKSIDNGGWVVAKHERNHVYLIAAGIA